VIPNHPFLAVRNGQPSKQFHSMTYNDANLARRTGLELVRYLEESGARWAILSGYEGFVAEEVRRVFPRERRLEHTVATLVGFRTWPALLLERRHRRDRRLLFDFEGDGYGGWESTGDAFDSGPSLANQPGQSFIVGQEGLRLANSFHPKLFDGATGTLVSAPFTIDRSSLSLLVGGGGSAATRIELQVRGRAIRTESGADNEILREVVWDLSAQQGQTARLAIIDEASGSWGHILVDQIELFRWADQ